ncbi:prophage endopeptidase tail family protein [Mammaliicoccus sciuri]|uniref:prophage endopeptidase tail family protein n=1 Tax=Mammaliicoccus sciuri TaxID=1296 RepID=UPI003F544B8E
MYNLIVMDRKRTMGEILIDFDYSSFKYEYEKNNERQISFTALKTNHNADVFNMLQNEAILKWKGQDYIIKSTSVKSNNLMLTNDIVGKHIFMEFQNHYIDKDIENEEMNGDVTEEEKPKYTLEQYLDFGFRNNPLGFKYVIKGKFDKRVVIDELGNKNGLEYLVEGAELFGYIYFADNKTIYIYDEAIFYKMSDEVIMYKYNTDEVQASVSTTEMKTIIEGYGLKKTSKETKNYNPIKTPALNFKGNFIKTGTWRTESVGASFEVQIDCRWCNETLMFNFKKGELGGVWDFYLDGEFYESMSAWSRRTITEPLIIAKNLSKGPHTFKGIFKGKDNKIDYKSKKPTGYVGTEKSTLFNITAVLKGKDIYKLYKQVKSKNYNVFGHMKAATVFDDNVESLVELEEVLREQLVDEPVVEVSTNYLGYEQIQENHKVHLKHKPLQYDTDLKVVKLTESHPIMNVPVEIEFSNARKDIVQIQQLINRNVRNVKSALKYGSGTAGNVGNGTSWVSTGVVTVDE